MIETLPSIEIPGHEPSGIGFPGHPMRVMTRRIAGLEQGGWDESAEKVVASLFDDLAPSWHTRSSPQRTRVVEDAMDRGLGALSVRSGMCVEVGSGIGTYSPLLAARFDQVISVELSWEMLVRAGAHTHRVRSDGGRLPLRDGAADVFVLINAFLFPDEVGRVLRPDGVVLWVNSSGEQTPIHLASEEVVGVLPFPVRAVESRAGAGTWCAMQRV